MNITSPQKIGNEFGMNGTELEVRSSRFTRFGIFAKIIFFWFGKKYFVPCSTIWFVPLNGIYVVVY